MHRYRFQLDDPRKPHSIALLKRHLDFTASVPPGIRHALDVEGLAVPSIRFWTVWDGDEPVGCAALKRLDEGHAELKSMHVIQERRGSGVADAIIVHLFAEARALGYRRISLETGSMDGYIPARRLYTRAGFRECAPFAAYVEDPLSTYMSAEVPPAKLDITAADPRAPEAAALLKAHLAHSWDSTPATSRHTYDAEALAGPGMRFWIGQLDGEAVACGALRDMGQGRFELKSMHTAESHRGQGLAGRMLAFLLERAEEAGATEILLETGTMEAYAAARRLYEGRGFVECPPFGDYVLDPNSVFMRLEVGG